MTIPSITNAAGVTFTFNDGDCEDITSDINANLDFDSMPASPPSDALLFDFNGASKTITVTGTLTEAPTTRTSTGSVTTIDAQRQWLEAYIDGFQLGSTFTSNYTSTWNGSSFAPSTVLVGSVRFNEQTGQPNVLFFTLTMTVGSV
jgi:hypothetical protein